jgi:hypothetical protein
VVGQRRPQIRDTDAVPPMPRSLVDGAGSPCRREMLAVPHRKRTVSVGDPLQVLRFSLRCGVDEATK